MFSRCLTSLLLPTQFQNKRITSLNDINISVRRCFDILESHSFKAQARLQIKNLDTIIGNSHNITTLRANATI